MKKSIIIITLLLTTSPLFPLISDNFGLNKLMENIYSESPTIKIKHDYYSGFIEAKICFYKNKNLRRIKNYYKYNHSLIYLKPTDFGDEISDKKILFTFQKLIQYYTSITFNYTTLNNNKNVELYYSDIFVKKNQIISNILIETDSEKFILKNNKPRYSSIPLRNIM
jgi:hypothetical protein